MLIECQLRLRILALENLRLPKYLFMLLTQVLTVPIDLKYLLVEINLVLFLLRKLLDIFLKLVNFKPYLLKMHDRSEQILCAQFLFFRQVTIKNLLKEALIYVLGLNFVCDVQFMQNLFDLH